MAQITPTPVEASWEKRAYDLLDDLHEPISEESATRIIEFIKGLLAE